MVTLPVRSMPQPWRLLYWRAAIFSLIGLTLILPENAYSGLSTAVLSMLLIVLGLLAVRFSMISRAGGQTAGWFLLAGLLDVGFGLILILVSGNPTEVIRQTLGGWGLLVGFIQAVESIYVFLGIQAAESSERTDFFLTIIHLINVLIGAGMAFMLLQQPAGTSSPRFAGVFPIAFSITLVILTRRLQMNERADQSKK